MLYIMSGFAGKGKVGELKDCVTAIQSQIENTNISEDISQDSPYRLATNISTITIYYYIVHTCQAIA